jgi:hypothetical protein
MRWTTVMTAMAGTGLGLATIYGPVVGAQDNRPPSVVGRVRLT